MSDTDRLPDEILKDSAEDAAHPAHKGMPLYLRIVIALLLGTVVGVAGYLSGRPEYVAWLEQPAKLILRLLAALAPPLVLVAVVNALIHADIRGPLARRLGFLLVLNTLVAIGVGLLVANVVRPGLGANLTPPAKKVAPSEAATDPQQQFVLKTVEDAGFTYTTPAPPIPDWQRTLNQFLDNVPRSLVGPFTDGGSVISVILIAIAFGLALRSMKDRPIRNVADVVQTAFDSLLVILHWVIAVVPIGVFGVVASLVATKGFSPFQALGKFVLAVILALLIQAGYYLLRVRFASWVSPLDLLRGGRDALVTAFSTASSTATMPLTYTALRDRVRLRQRSAGMGALVGANFNNDGTALYEAMSALFISQAIGQHLSIAQQFLVVLTSIAASVGAAGIPEAGLVTMTLVFQAVGLPVEYIPLLLTVDWFLDRCRTAINVMGDMNVSCVLDGKTPETAEERAFEEARSAAAAAEADAPAARA